MERTIIGKKTVCVAVGADIEESKLTLHQAFEFFPRRNFCILHVHRRAQVIESITEGFQPITISEQDELRKIANDIRDRILDDYLLICLSAGKHARKLHIEMDDVAKGIVELVRQHNIKNLVMGAGANRHFTEGMNYLESEKALYVKQYVSPSCNVWFNCSGQFIHGREIFEVGSSNVLSSSSSNLIGSSGLACNSDFNVFDGAEESQCGESYVLLQSGRTSEHFEGSGNSELEEVLLEAEKINEEASEELVKRMQAQKSAIQSVCSQARKFERLYAEELRRGREAEAEIERLKRLRDEEKLRYRDALLQSRAASSAKISSLVQQLELCKKERDDLKVELEDAQELKNQDSSRQEEETASMRQCLTEFSLDDITEATNEYDPSMEIGRGTNGIIFKGLLNHNQVAIKLLEFSLELFEYEREVDILRKLSHPNLVKLIGTCPDIRALVYESLPNASLEDRLSCKDDSPPLSWKTRIGIAADICSVLFYLHSRRPYKVIHGNLQPRNIFLDTNFVCKLGEIGLGQVLSHLPTYGITIGASPYHNPQFYTTEPSSCDIYAFGIILLQLLTGRSPSLIDMVVQEKLESENPCNLLDSSAGEWPYSETEAVQLLYMALRCCDKDKSRRSDLEMDVFPLLEQLRASSASVLAIPDEVRQPPSYFFCPISLDIMKDPCIAADGLTYEREDMSKWLSDNDTSPKTNLRLANRTLIPNLALRSAIQEWLHHHPFSLHCE